MLSFIHEKLTVRIGRPYDKPRLVQSYMMADRGSRVNLIDGDWTCMCTSKHQIFKAFQSATN